MSISQRIATLFLLFIGLALLSLYPSAVLFALLQWGPSKVPSLEEYKALYDYWVIWLEYADKYQGTANFNLFTASNYYFPKLIFATGLPYVLMGIAAYLLRGPIKRSALFRPKGPSLHGDAHWATEADIKSAKLNTGEGMLLGTNPKKKGYLTAGGYQHTLLFAPTGSGKGVGFVIPNLLYWEDSIVVHDIKLENYELTSGWRQKQGQKVFLWNPASPDGLTHCYNPLDWISDKPGQMVDDVQKISSLLLPEQEFWQNEARSLLVGVILYLLAHPLKPNSFGEVVRTMRGKDVVQELTVGLDTLGDKIHPVGVMNLNAFLQKSDKERSGVISTLNSKIELWTNPFIDAATSKSDFNLMNLKKEATTIYVGLTPDNIQRLQPLMQIFYQQATEFLCRKMPTDDEPYGVMFLMDEFPTLGKMEQFKNGIAYFRGFKVRLFLIIQDTQQLKGIYEEAGMNSFLSNSTYRVTYAANNVETATLISQLVGNKTVKQASISKGAGPFSFFSRTERTTSISETQRALLLPQEVINLSRDEQILLIESQPPIKTDKIKYYQDKFFTERLLPAIEIPHQSPVVSEDPNEKLEDVTQLFQQLQGGEEGSGEMVETGQAVGVGESEAVS